MKKTFQLFALAAVLVLSACQSQIPQATVLPQATATPFGLYGSSLMDETYCTPEDSPQKMDLYFPASGGPWPVLVFVHGGSWTEGDKAEAAEMQKNMNEQGYVLVSINYRLYPTVRFPAMIEDVKCAIRSLRANASQFNIDPNRIAVRGDSAGGHLVSLLATSDPANGWDGGEYSDQSSRIQAAIVLAPATDFSQEFSNDDIQMLVYVAFGTRNIPAASPITHITSDDPPFLLIHGNRDPVIPFEQSQSMYDALQKAGVPAELVVVENADHSLTAPDGSAKPTLEEIDQLILDFLAKYLK
jgi:acetyl esterase/lipase